eukprot:4820729-Pyramimonas_sp.AAC.1
MTGIAEHHIWQHFAMRAQARAQRRASVAWQQTRSEISKWAIENTKGSMKGAHCHLKKPGRQALDETCRRRCRAGGGARHSAGGH